MESHLLLQTLRTTNHINHLKQIHALITTKHYSLLPIFAQRLLTLSHMQYARHVFDEIPQPDERLYNAFIRTYTRVSSYKQAVGMFCLMRRRNILVTNYTIPPVLKSCSALLMVEFGKQVHGLIVSSGFGSNCFVQTALMDLYARSGDLVSAKLVFDDIVDRDCIAYNCLISGYSKRGDVVAARRLFDEMSERTVVTWNSIMSCYAGVGDLGEALRLYERMQGEKVEPNEYTLATVLSICASAGDLEMGLKLKKYVDDNNMLRNMIVATALMEMFIKCGAVLEARQVFDHMSEKDIFTWATMISGYAQNSCPTEALELFECMRRKRVKPNDVIFVSILSACTQLGSVEAGEKIGSYVESYGFDSNMYVGSALLNMHLKCGNIKKAWQVFERVHEKDAVYWNSMISGLGFNGHAIDAICTFEKMMEANVRPNNVTFLALLSACTHAGLVDQGLALFESMHSKHGILPQIDHHACIVDLFCRSGRLNEAYEFICRMEEEPNVVIWGTLLSGCRIHLNTEVAEIALKNLLEMEPENSGNYVLLSNLYVNSGRWQDAARVRKLMQDRNVQKTAAYSWVELDDEIHKFLVGDTSHPRCVEIYEVVDCLVKLSTDDTDNQLTV